MLRNSDCISTVSGSGGLVAKSCPILMTPWAIPHQASLSMGFPRQEYWSGLSFSFPGNLPDPGIKPKTPAYQADPLLSEPRKKERKERKKVKSRSHV